MKNKVPDFGLILKHFVKELHGRYNKHISDELLVELLELLITNRVAYYANKETLENSVYLGTYPLFEKILEYNLNMGGNGHHVAQELAEKFAKE